MPGRKRRRKEPIHPIPQGRDTVLFLCSVCYLASSEQGAVPPGAKGANPPSTPTRRTAPPGPKSRGHQAGLGDARGPPSAKGIPRFGCWERPWGQEEQGCSWSPGLWVSGEKGLQRGSTSGDTDWCHSPARGHHPFFKVLLDFLPGPPRAPGQEHPPSQQHLGCK